MARSRRTSARPVAVGAVAVLAAVLSGCSATNPITTEVAYSASDGVRASLGDLTAENLLLVAAAADEPGALQGALSNRGDEALTVELATESSTERIRVDSGETLLLGGTEGEDVLLETPEGPGATTEMTLTTDAGGTVSVQVPVLDGTLPEYADLVPEEVTPTSTPGAEPTEPTVSGTTEPGTTTETAEAEQPGGSEG
ncbi:hypothetical protein [Cellulomonas hominis]|uniref:hypothetical protein n=1 Tax=Cellulomonas hominis TaxID=156981 RepID=UPI001BA386F7|nr:hypothetical protein [Cellulomonas hominis]VTR78769.1 hypothetical protein CHMI_03554 [Cellulomonas hominis]